MNERISNVLKNPWTIPVAVGVVAFGSGVGVGYFLANKRKPTEVLEDEQLTLDFDPEELAEMSRIIEEEKYSPPIFAPETDAEVVDDSVIVRPTVTKDVETEEEVKLIEINVFEQAEEDWDWETEVESRDPEKPYILHRDEYYRQEENYTQITLTYFEGDDLMADENNQLVYNYESVTGPLKFGHGSGDPNVVLVRNNERRAEYEIYRNPGMFSTEVLGLEAEDNERAKDIKHSRVSKFRMD